MDLWFLHCVYIIHQVPESKQNTDLKYNLELNKLCFECLTCYFLEV